LLGTSCGGSSGSTGGSGGGGGGGGSTGGATSGEYLWEVGGVTNNLAYATINTTTGPLGSPTVAAGPASNPTNYPSIVVAPSGNYLYAFYWTFSELETFQVFGPGLQLEFLAGADYTFNMPYEWSMVLHPSGKVLYVFMSGIQSTIQELSIDESTGGMTLGPAVEESADVRVGVFDPAGKYLFVNDATDGGVLVFQVNQTNGSLTPVANSPFKLPSGEQPTQLAIGGSGASSFLYADLYISGGIGGGIAAFSINSSTGALTVVPGSPFQSGVYPPAYICVDPSKRFLYGSNLTPGSIYALAIDPVTGALTPIAGSPFSTAPTSLTIAIDPSGQFLYVTNYANSNIYGFSINAATGGLSPLTGSPFPSVAQPEGLTMMAIQ
jgi:6-phosphogluconolactonase (cycloisomerase 2 family)